MERFHKKINDSRGNSVGIKNINKNNNLNNKEYLEKKIYELEQRFNNKLNSIQNELNEKFKTIKIDTIQNNFDDKLENFKKEILDLVNFVKIKITENSVPENHSNVNNERKNFIENLKHNFKEKKMNDFIKIYKINELGYKNYTPNDIEQKNEEIITFLNDKILDDYLVDENEEKCINETVGNFLYSIGGISRKSFQLTKDIYHEFFNEYKKYLKSNNEWLTFEHEKDRRNLSIWIKKCLDEKNFYEYYSIKNIKIIEKYLYNDDKTDNILFKLFKDFIELYIKCYLSFPSIEIKYTGENIEFNAKIMKDYILKNAKKKKVNFCYLPGLISNGDFIKNGKYNVFTYCDNTFQIKENIFEEPIKEQSIELYTIPNKSQIKFKFNFKFDETKSNCNIITEIEPSISPDLNPNFILCKLINQNSGRSISENETGIFKVSREYFYSDLWVKLIYASFEKDSQNFTIPK